VFEAYCKALTPDGEPEPTEEQMWAKSTIIERTCSVIILHASTATGMISEKPKAGVLFQLRDALWWWIQRYIKDVFDIYGHWHTMGTAAIHKAATLYNFETGWLEKNNLTDAELTLFWKLIEKPKKSMVGLDNWKQHYVAWMLIWVTSTRPGSITVGYGFEAGSLITKGKAREEDETLRWKDLEFFRIPSESGGGIGVRGVFHFQKGFRVPHQQKQISGERRFTILPLNSDRYHLDLALLLTALAFSRGLFPHESLDELFKGDEVHIEQNVRVSNEAVLLACNQAGITPGRKAMRENSLNPKLREACDLVGLVARNTVYGFRRGAIVDQRRKSGTETSQELAGHIMQGKSVYSYDTIGIADMDLANIRAGAKATDRTYIRELFSQANSKRFDFSNEEAMATASILAQGTSSQGNLIRSAANAQAAGDRQTLEHVDLVAQAYNHGKQMAISKGVSASSMTVRIHIHDQLTALSQGGHADCQAALDAIEKAKYDLALIKRTLLRSYKVSIRQNLLKDAKKNQKLALGGNRMGSRGQSTEQERAAIAAARQSGQFDQQVDELEAFDVEEVVGDEDEAEIEDPDDAEDDLWKDVPEGEQVTFQDRDGDDTYSAAGRLTFAKKFVDQSVRPTTGLTCTLCLMDPTVPYQKQAQKYSKSKLEEHLLSNYHDREKEIMRGWHIDADGQPPKSTCPLCKRSLVAKGFIAHVEEYHKEQLDL
jgi:hypothetical protein